MNRSSNSLAVKLERLHFCYFLFISENKNTRSEETKQIISAVSTLNNTKLNHRNISQCAWNVAP